MKAKGDILKLGESFGIEAPHTRHVARLALDLFDGFAPLDGLAPSDRKLLFAAATLHDIGYASNPENHVAEAARILSENPIDGFEPNDWRAVVGAVLLHKREWRQMLGHDKLAGIGEPQLERIKRIAAILRIADGLDHSHIQDASVTYCRHGKKVDRIGVLCTCYAGNIPWAEGKADLWESVFKRPFRIEGNIAGSKHAFGGIVGKKDAAIPAARRILYSQWCIMRDNAPGMVEGRDPEHLHDYRVALRRFRAALRMFKPLLEGTSHASIDRRLKDLSDHLGPLRDIHVALELVRNLFGDDAAVPRETLARLEQEAQDLKAVYMKGLLDYADGRLAPDANSTIRLTFGTVNGYSPRDAVIYEPITTLSGVMEKDTGEFPFDVPEKIEQLYETKNIAPYADSEENDIVTCFLNTTNVTGGNSGSPTLNAKGEQIGIIFDMTYESVIGDYYIVPEWQRTISVDIRYVLFVVDKFSGAEWLINELGFSSSI